MNELEILLSQAIDAQKKNQTQVAIEKYNFILAENQDHLFANYNLGLLLIELGKLKSGMLHIDRISAQILNQAEHTNAYAIIGARLFEYNHWEHAKFWLAQALNFRPMDERLKWMFKRAENRDYLKPEVFDPLANKTLLRYSPREADTYIYTIDIAGTCNLRCPSCPVGNTALGERGIGMMALNLFSKIMLKIAEESPSAQPQIWLFNWGEPLLHPKLADFIREIKTFGFSSHLSTNLNVTTGIAEMVKAEPSEIKISLSGFTEETYSKTHTRGSIHLLKANMYLLKHEIIKQRKTIRVWVGQHVYKHNQADIEKVKNICAELGFEHHPIQAFFQPVEKLVRLAQGQRDIKDEAVLNNLIRDPVDYINNKKAHRDDRYDCELRFNQTVINYDGEVALCCSTYEKSNTLGVAFLDHSHEDIESLKYKHEFCKTCRKHACDYSSLKPMDKT
ncbi:hypothetical protein [Glaciecola sp. KUL10]|uniref:hypothetical protein n=1 Tax=Glaciecola sp. (strain KUL10) TaxID=2161813 RepID=UPI000D787C55|nr:hypothetical protein [Glaciecola sp. KUL10]GBL06268.1 radical SAM domain protein [Glaciecola sp. KUL10]